MRNHEISSPNAAEMYFNHSIFGQLYTLVAEALGGARRERRSSERPTARRIATAAARPSPPPTLLDRLDAWFWRKAQDDREAYLARSADVFELERRIEALERGAITRYY